MKKLLFVCFAALLVVAFTVPAMAADEPVWNFYGSARMATWSANSDKYITGTNYSDRETRWDLQANSRIGASVTDGAVGGRFEYGEDSPNSNTSLRLMYGTWNFGAGTLEVGQDYTPVFSLLSNQTYGDDDDLVSWGGLYEGRQPMIEVQIAGFRFAAVRPVANAGNIDGQYATLDHERTVLPKLEARYDLRMGPARVGLMAGYNSVNLVSDTNKTKSLTAWVYGIDAEASFGPAYLKALLWGGKNVGNYGIYTNTDSSADWSGTKVTDTDTIGGNLIAGFKVNDMLAFEAGYGYVSSEDDITTNQKDKGKSYYLQATITLAKNVTVTPEVGVFDGMKDDTGVKQGKTTYAGAKWQINF
jgi:hypothetical protein